MSDRLTERIEEWEELAATISQRRHDRLSIRAGAALVGAAALLRDAEARAERAEGLVQRYLVSHETDQLLATGKRQQCPCDICRAAASSSRAGLTAPDAETVISTAPNQSQTQAVTPLAKASGAVSPSGAEGAEG